MKTNKRMINLTAVVVIFLLAVYFLFINKSTSLEDKENEKKDTATTTIIVEDKTIEVPKRVVIEEIPLEKSITAPNLDRTIVVSDIFSASAEQLVRNKISDAINKINLDPSSYKNWINLGNLRRTIRDYDGAKEIYEYLAKVFPTNYISFVNLGTLYHLNLRDFRKSEENFQRALEINPKNEVAYIAFHELYKYSYKQNTSLAEDILLEGLGNTEDNPDLLVLLAGYYKEKGDTANARTYYEKARDEVLIRGNQSLADLLQEEINNL